MENNTAESYYKQYYNKNKEAWKEKYICQICGHKYSKPNKYNHLQSKKHMLGEQQRTIEKLRILANS